MKSEEIEVIVDPDGQVRVTVKGVKGKGCVGLTGPLEEALGGEIEKRVFTSEYYEDEPSQKVSIPLQNRRRT